MSSLERAVKIAIEKGGYKRTNEPNHRMVWHEKTGWWDEWDTEDENGEPCVLEHPCCYDHPLYQNGLVLDPLFWQALGKALGAYPALDVVYADGVQVPMTWGIYWWHKYIDVLNANGDQEKFWSDLLK